MMISADRIRCACQKVGIFLSGLFVQQRNKIMEMNRSFTKGPILRVLLKFALPVLAVLFLQALYGEVDLLVVGQFGTAADVSAVAFRQNVNA